MLSTRLKRVRNCVSSASYQLLVKFSMTLTVVNAATGRGFAGLIGPDAGRLRSVPPS